MMKEEDQNDPKNQVPQGSRGDKENLAQSN